jgi:hypothetical protein
VLIEMLRRLDDRTRPIAETYRELADLAELLDFSRPSYQQVRVHVHELRLQKQLESRPSVIPLYIAYRARLPAWAISRIEASADPGPRF